MLLSTNQQRLFLTEHRLCVNVQFFSHLIALYLKLSTCKVNPNILFRIVTGLAHCMKKQVYLSLKFLSTPRSKRVRNEMLKVSTRRPEPVSSEVCQTPFFLSLNSVTSLLPFFSFSHHMHQRNAFEQFILSLSQSHALLCLSSAVSKTSVVTIHWKDSDVMLFVLWYSVVKAL